MKRILLYTMMAFVTLAACNKESNDVFDKTPNERMAEKLAAYQAALQAAQYGWNAELTT
jgi:hypothetical protein